MPNYSRMISVNRDNILAMTSESAFFEKNPGLVFLQEELNACRASFDESAKKAGCKCRADAGLLHGCVSKFLTTLDVAKEINKPLVEDFVRYVGKVDNIAGVGVTIFYVKPGEKTPHRYTFPE
jgi:hypothetical protein